MEQMEIRTIQLQQLEVLKEVDRVCKKHDITYYLYAGTLLGAVRHKGFIPWDDDIDIAMIRTEYQRFLDIFSKELNQKYFLQTYRSDPYFSKSLARVCIPGTFVDIKYSQHIPFNKSLYLDIFVLDLMPEEEEARMKQANDVGRIDKLIALKSGYVYDKGFLNSKLIVKTIIRKILSPLPFRFLMNRRERIIRRYENSNSEYLCNFQHQPGYKNHIRQAHRVSRFGEPTYLEFEGGIYPAPNDWEGYLKQTYGDYMKLPPEEERKPESDVYFL